jgi:hypothetical protein
VVALDRVAGAAGALGLAVRAGTVSALPGPAGNIEFFLWLAPGVSGSEPVGGDLAGARASGSEPVGGDLAGARASGSEPVGGDPASWSAMRDRLVAQGEALRAARAGLGEGEPSEPAGGEI